MPCARRFLINAAWSAASDIPDRYMMEIHDRIKEDVAMARKIELEGAEKIIAETKAHLGTRFTRMTSIAKGGDPSTEILREAETLRPDLVAVVSRGMKGIEGMLGSVSRRVLAHSAFPVLVGKTCDG